MICILPVFKAQNEETAILLSHPTGEIRGPAVALFRIHGLDDNRLQVQMFLDPLPCSCLVPDCVRGSFMGRMLRAVIVMIQVCQCQIGGRNESPYVCGGLFAKRGPIQGNCFPICFLQVGCILICSPPEVVMQDGAEAVLAIFKVLLGIQDMEMPEVGNRRGRQDETICVLPAFKTQNEETAIPLSHPTGKIQGPDVAFFGIHGLDDNRLQVQVCDNPLPSPAQAGRGGEGCPGLLVHGRNPPFCVRCWIDLI